ncbi:MAG: bifunctional metallophosphatase/5'-nucleotidase [Candidatus Brocadiae bacterium]|nr:bifunctional metallophosphatase/5'-nucleotidase [Candidatus Brocadiia bacterium]
MRPLLLLLLVLFPAISSPAEEITLTILHTNDLHGALLPQSDPDSSGNRGPLRGGVARLSTAIAEQRTLAAREGRDILLVDAGDIFHGTPEGNVTRGAAVIAWMNMAGYDALAPGNHDWAYGDRNLADLRRDARFAFVTCNVTRVDPAAATAPIVDYARAWAVFVKRGIRVAVVGFTTPGTPDMNLPEHVKDLDFLPYARQAAYTLRQARAEADVIVALSHLGSLSDDKLAENTPGWDLIVGGHDHRSFPSGLEKHGTLIVQAGSSGDFLGRADLVVDRETRKVLRRTAQLIPITQETAEDPAARKLVEEARVPGLDDRIGAAAAAIRRAGPRCPLGALVADAIRVAADADCAFINSGGIRNDLASGAVTRRDLYMVAPFEDTLVVYDLTGAEIRILLDAAFRDGRMEYPVSGLSFTWDPKQPSGERAVALKVRGEPVDMTRTYTVASTTFAANRLGGDSRGKRILQPAGTPRARRALAVTLQDALLRPFEGGRIVAPPEDERVTFPRK